MMSPGHVDLQRLGQGHGRKSYALLVTYSQPPHVRPSAALACIHAHSALSREQCARPNMYQGHQERYRGCGGRLRRGRCSGAGGRRTCGPGSTRAALGRTSPRAGGPPQRQTASPRGAATCGSMVRNVRTESGAPPENSKKFRLAPFKSVRCRSSKGP